MASVCRDVINNRGQHQPVSRFDTRYAQSSSEFDSGLSLFSPSNSTSRQESPGCLGARLPFGRDCPRRSFHRELGEQAGWNPQTSRAFHLVFTMIWDLFAFFRRPVNLFPPLSPTVIGTKPPAAIPPATVRAPPGTMPMPPLIIKREEIDDDLPFPPLVPQLANGPHPLSVKTEPLDDASWTRQQEARRNDQPSENNLGLGQQRPHETTHRINPTVGGDRGPDRAQQYRQLKPLRDALHLAQKEAPKPNGTVYQRWRPYPERRAGAPPACAPHAAIKQEPPTQQARVQQQLAPQHVIKQDSELQHHLGAWPARIDVRQRMLYFQPVFGRTSLPRSRVKHRQIRDVKPNIIPWAQYAGPSPWATLFETPSVFSTVHVLVGDANKLRRVVANDRGRLMEGFMSPEAVFPSEPIKQEPRILVRGAAFITPRMRREMSSDEDEPCTERIKRQPMGTSKRSSHSDGVQERPLKRARGFSYQPSQSNSEYRPSASKLDEVKEGEIGEASSHESHHRGSGSDMLGGHGLGGAFDVPPVSCFGSALGQW
ncbi:hypothetical protein QBC39DRAFT_355849 [Podospora conica]|nr:hypothetical protein QBC39DRAFT_355849 [Schizothecium conicum]